jgi:hypothetical protein
VAPCAEGSAAESACGVSGATLRDDLHRITVGDGSADELAGDADRVGAVLLEAEGEGSGVSRVKTDGRDRCVAARVRVCIDEPQGRRQTEYRKKKDVRALPSRDDRDNVDRNRSLPC